MTLTIRPRWRRIAHVPRLLHIYRKAGCGWLLSARIAYQAVMFQGRWQGEQRTGEDAV